MSSVSRGLSGERRVWRHLEECDYLVSSRRHIGGAGDLLAIGHPDFSRDESIAYSHRPLLVEVKTDKAGPFATFSPADRIDLLYTAQLHGCEGILAWTPYPSCIFYLPTEEWPTSPTLEANQGGTGG